MGWTFEDDGCYFQEVRMVACSETIYRSPVSRNAGDANGFQIPGR